MIGTFDIRSMRKVDGFRIGTRGGLWAGTLERDRRRLVSTLRRGLECSLVVFLRSIFEGGCVLLILLLLLMIECVPEFFLCSIGVDYYFYCYYEFFLCSIGVDYYFYCYFWCLLIIKDLLIYKSEDERVNMLVWIV